MKRCIFSFVLSMSIIFFLAGSSGFAQNRTTRLQEQHKTKYLKKNLPTIEKMLMHHLQNDSSDTKLSAVQTLRQLEQIFPEESFSSLIEPLIKIVVNEESDTQLRIISAIALDELHSDKGDKAIYEIAKNSTSESVKNACIAISFEISKLSNDGIVQGE